MLPLQQSGVLECHHVSHILKNENYELCFLAGSYLLWSNYDRKKRYSRLANGWNKSQITVCHVKIIQTPIITKLDKITTGNKVQSSGRWLEHKTQNTTHTDTTTNRMSHATVPSSGFAPSLSMGRAVAPPNHGAPAPQRHAQAANCRGCARCRWFACLER